MKKSKNVVLKATALWGPVARPMLPSFDIKAVPRKHKKAVESTLVYRRELILRRRARGKDTTCMQHTHAHTPHSDRREHVLCLLKARQVTNTHVQHT